MTILPKHTITFLLCFTLSIIFSQDGQIHFEPFALEHGLPQGHVHCIHEDKQGFMWFGTAGGLTKFDGYEFTIFEHEQRDSNSITGNWVYEIEDGPGGDLWIGVGSGLHYYDRNQNKFFRFLHDPSDENTVRSNNVRGLLYDSKGRLWVGTSKGLDLYLEKENRFIHFKNKTPFRGSKWTSEFLEDSKGNIWGSGTSGIFKVDMVDTTVQWFPLILNENETNTKVGVGYMIEEGNGNLVMATKKGIWRMNVATKTFSRIKIDPKYDNTEFRTVIEYPKGTLWVGSRYFGVFKIDLKTDKLLAHYTYSPFVKSPLLNNTIFSMKKDSYGNLWIGTFNGANKVNANAQKFQLYQYEPGKNNPKNYVLKLHQDAKGQVWASTMKGLHKAKNIGASSEGVDSIFKNDNRYVGVRRFCLDNAGLLWMSIGGNHGLAYYGQDSDGIKKINSSALFGNRAYLDIKQDVLDPEYLWLGTDKGLCKWKKFTSDTTWYFAKKDYPELASNRTANIVQLPDGNLWIKVSNKLFFFNPKTGIFTNHKPNPSTSNAHPLGTFRYLAATKKGLAIASMRGLIWYDFQTKKFTNYDKNNGMPQNEINALLADNNEDIWITTLNYLTKFEPDTKKFTAYHPIHDMEEFNTESAYKSPDGKLFFGGVNGYFAFYPDEIPFDTIPPSVVLKSFTVSQKEMDFGKATELVKEIALTYQDRVFTFKYAALQFVNSKKNRYKHQLEGFDKEWQEDGTKREATYTNLAPGHYTFKVLAANEDGIWSKKPLAIKLYISPPYWQTSWFYALIALIILSILYAVYTSNQKSRALAKEKEVAEKSAAYQSMFLANMSHEIRTPMNAIVGMNELMLGTGLDEKQKEYSEIIQQSAENLLVIINDILDHSKIKSGKYSFVKKPFELDILLQQLFKIFELKAAEKNLDFKTAIDKKIPNHLIGDATRLNQILMNLVGNAIKFTDNGSVQLSVKIAKKIDKDFKLQFAIKDTGKGIPEEKLDNIFESFQQLDNEENVFHTGTGLGLSIARQLVQQQNGEIWVESTLNSGTTFFFTLPFETTQPKSITKTAIQNTANSLKNLSVLIVEDTLFNQMLAVELIKKNIAGAKIEVANNGQVALEKIKNESFDLILMDVKMPVMDGFEATRNIRKMEAPMKDLPILAITANAIPEELEKCKTAGMNDYITKPINGKELFDKIADLLKGLGKK